MKRKRILSRFVDVSLGSFVFQRISGSTILLEKKIRRKFSRWDFNFVSKRKNFDRRTFVSFLFWDFSRKIRKNENFPSNEKWDSEKRRSTESILQERENDKFPRSSKFQTENTKEKRKFAVRKSEKRFSLTNDLIFDVRRIHFSFGSSRKKRNVEKEISSFFILIFLKTKKK